MEWNVRIETASPDEVQGPDLDVLTQRFGDMLAKLEPYAAIGGLGHDGWDVTVTVDVADQPHAPELALNEGASLVLGAASAVGLPGWRVVDVHVIESELAWARTEVPNFPDIVGSAEVLEMLGVTKQRLSQLRQSGRFPDPMIELGATPVWLRSGVEGFLASWDRRGGRPRSTISDQLAAKDELEAELGNLGRPNT